MIYESSKQLPNWSKPYEAFSDSNQIAINEAISAFAMNIKAKLRNKCSHEKAECVYLQYKDGGIEIYSNQNKNKKMLQVKNIWCDGIKI